MPLVDDTMQTRVFDIVRGFAWPEHYPGRELRNAVSEKWHSREEELQTSRSDVEAAYLAASPDDFSVRAVWAGEGVDLVRDRQPAAAIISRIVEEAVMALQAGSNFVKIKTARKP
jgi:nitronate monooxygenase